MKKDMDESLEVQSTQILRDKSTKQNIFLSIRTLWYSIWNVHTPRSKLLRRIYFYKIQFERPSNKAIIAIDEVVRTELNVD